MPNLKGPWIFGFLLGGGMAPSPFMTSISTCCAIYIAKDHPTENAEAHYRRHVLIGLILPCKIIQFVSTSLATLRRLSLPRNMHLREIYLCRVVNQLHHLCWKKPSLNLYSSGCSPCRIPVIPVKGFGWDPRA